MTMCIELISAGVSKITGLFSSAAPWVSAVGTVMSAYGAMAQGEAVAAAAEYNAKLAERDAQMAAKRGQQEEAHVRLKGAIVKAKQRAMFGASGLDVSRGSPLDVLMATQFNIEEDAATIRYNALNEQLSYGAKARGYRSEASSARSAGKIGAMTALFSGATDFATKWDSLALSASKKAGATAAPKYYPSSVGYDQFGRVYIVR